MQGAKVEEKYREVLQRVSIEQRLRIVFELHEIGRKLVRAGIQSVHPTWDEQSIETALRQRLYAHTRTAN